MPLPAESSVMHQRTFAVLCWLVAIVGYWQRSSEQPGTISTHVWCSVHQVPRRPRCYTNSGSGRKSASARDCQGGMDQQRL